MTSARRIPEATVSAAELDRLVDRTIEELPRERLDVLGRTIARNPRSTIEPETVRSDALGRSALVELGAAGARHDIDASVELERTLGEGGMGVVRLGTQRSLGRKVAVKTLKPEGRTEQNVLRLLREAWVTGALEHPNIVPVYDLGLDAEGAPVIVLKRIEGDVWSELLRDAEAVRTRFGQSDLLEHNLRILVQLCNAVSLAHARGVLHRDLKPENVMIGSFGEVYLVDWGVAVGLREDPTGRLPSAGANAEMAGTPVYMAPEMLGTGAPLSERTDVYLLGAILHEILTGRPPHDGDNFRAIVASILRSQPTYPDDVPRELVAIATKAMRFEPAERFASAEELRARLEWYLRHRGSLALSEEAGRSLARLREVVRADAAGAREQVYRLFAEARFGFRQALAASPDNTGAEEQLREAIGTVAEWELAHGAPEAAASLLAELEVVPPDLAARIETARRAQAERAARLSALERDLDPSVGRRTRAFVAAVLGLVWSAFPLVCWWAELRYGVMSATSMYALTLSIVVLAFGLTYWARDSLNKSLVNRRAIATARFAFAAQLALEVGAKTMGFSPATTLVLHPFVWFTAACAFALFVDARMWPTAVGYLTCFLLGSLRPDLAWGFGSLGSVVMLVNVAMAWRAEGDLTAAAERIREARGRRRRP